MDEHEQRNQQLSLSPQLRNLRRLVVLPWPVTDAELMANLVLDIGALTALLYFFGGSTNPFVTFYLIPLSIAAAMLPARYTWTLVGVTLACYSALLFSYVPLPSESGSFDWLAILLPSNLAIGSDCT